MSTRRKFLALVGMAPVAVPVAAKEAAAAMGVSGPLGAGSAGMNIVAGGYPMANSVEEDHDGFLKRKLKRLDGGEEGEHSANDARYSARVLDADIASLRSISPSAAYAIQRQRTFDEFKRRRRASLLQDLAAYGKRSLLG